MQFQKKEIDWNIAECSFGGTSLTRYVAVAVLWLEFNDADTGSVLTSI